MEFPVDIWLRGDNHATTETIAPVVREPRAWTDGDVADVLIGMLRAIDRASRPDASAERPIALRGFSWIVVSTMLIGAGSVDVSALPSFPNTRSTSGIALSFLSICWITHPASRVGRPGNVVGM